MCNTTWPRLSIRSAIKRPRSTDIAIDAAAPDPWCSIEHELVRLLDTTWCNKYGVLICPMGSQTWRDALSLAAIVSAASYDPKDRLYAIASHDVVARTRIREVAYFRDRVIEHAYPSQYLQICNPGRIRVTLIHVAGRKKPGPSHVRCELRSGFILLSCLYSYQKEIGK